MTEGNGPSPPQPGPAEGGEGAESDAETEHVAKVLQDVCLARLIGESMLI